MNKDEMFTIDELTTIHQALEIAKRFSIKKIEDLDKEEGIKKINSGHGKCFVKDIEEINDKIYKLITGK